MSITDCRHRLKTPLFRPSNHRLLTTTIVFIANEHHHHLPVLAFFYSGAFVLFIHSIDSTLLLYFNLVSILHYEFILFNQCLFIWCPLRNPKSILYFSFFTISDNVFAGCSFGVKFSNLWISPLDFISFM